MISNRDCILGMKSVLYMKVIFDMLALALALILQKLRMEVARLLQ